MYHAMACLTVPKLLYLGEHSEVSQARSLHACWTRMLYHDRLETIDNLTVLGRKEEGGKNEAAFTTLIYFFSVYNMEVQLTRKWHRHHKLWRKKIVLVAGLRKGRRKEFGRTLVRVRGGNNKGPIPFSLPPPQLKSLPFPFERKPRRPRKR